MNIDLTPDQINLIAQRQGIIAATKLELNHAEEKLNLLITGIATAKGLTGQFNYSISNNQLIIEVPEEPLPIKG